MERCQSVSLEDIRTRQIRLDWRQVSEMGKRERIAENLQVGVTSCMLLVTVSTVKSLSTKWSAPTTATGESETKVGVEVSPSKLRAIIAVGYFVLFTSMNGDGKSLRSLQNEGNEDHEWVKICVHFATPSARSVQNIEATGIDWGVVYLAMYLRNKLR